MHKSLRMGLLGGMVLALTISLGACTATVEDKELLAQVAIQHATAKVIEAGSDPVQRAARVFDIASEARSLLSGETVSLPLLEGAVRNRLTATQLSPSDMLLVDTLVRYISVELARQVGSEKLSADQKLKVDKVLSWVIASATITQPPINTDPST